MRAQVAGLVALATIVSTACGRTAIPDILSPASPPGDEPPQGCDASTGAFCGDNDGDNDGNNDGDAGGDAAGDSGPEAAVATLQPSTYSAVADTASTATWTHTVKSGGTLPFLLVLVTVDDAQRFPSSVSIDGTAMTALAQQGAVTYGALSAWGTSDIASGPHSITVTLPSPDTFIARSLTVFGVDPANPMGAVASGLTSGPGASSALASDVNDLAFAIVSWQSAATTTWQTGNTEIWDDVLQPPVTDFDFISSSAAIADRGPNVSFGWTPSVSNDNFGAYLAFNLRHAPAE